MPPTDPMKEIMKSRRSQQLLGQSTHPLRSMMGGPSDSDGCRRLCERQAEGRIDCGSHRIHGGGASGRNAISELRMTEKNQRYITRHLSNPPLIQQRTTGELRRPERQLRTGGISQRNRRSCPSLLLNQQIAAVERPAVILAAEEEDDRQADHDEELEAG